MANKQRLIDANAVLDKIRNSTASAATKVTAFVFVDTAPTVDAVNAVEVVRCRDCKHYCNDKRYGTICIHPALDYDVECYAHWLSTEPDDFCSYGKRRTDGETERT